MRRILTMLLFSGLVLTAFTGAASAYRLIEHREWTIPAGGRTGFSVRNIRGSIKVVGWDRDEIMIAATVRIRAASKNKAQRIYDHIEFEIGQEPGNKSIHAIVPVAPVCP